MSEDIQGDWQPVRFTPHGPETAHGAPAPECKPHLDGRILRVRPIKMPRYARAERMTHGCDCEQGYQIHPDDVAMIAPELNGKIVIVSECEIQAD